MTEGEQPTVTGPDDGLERHIERLANDKRMIGLQAKIRATKNGFLLVRVVSGVPVRWDDVRLTVQQEKLVSL